MSDLDFKGRRALIRVDFNVPLDKSGAITDDTRIQSALPTIQYVLDHGGAVILMSHFGRPKGKAPEFSLAPCAKRLSELLKKPVTMAPDCIGREVEALAAKMKPGDVMLLENVRFYPAEEKPEKDPDFAKNLARLGDLYIDDAFGSAHRAHSSVVGVAKYFPGKAVPGFLMEKEIQFLGHALASPKRPFYAIIGGAKISTKIGVLGALIQKTDGIFIGGGMAFTFFKALGIPIGSSICEEEMVETAKKLIADCKEKKIPLFLPLDVVAATSFEATANFDTFNMSKGIPDGYQGMDIGEKTQNAWEKSLHDGRTILWNGPVGVYEFPNFAAGTNKIAKALAGMKEAVTIAGGGETVAAINGLGLGAFFSHISTGGGASLEYIEKGSLPGIDALG
jgi:phosphoglycerate kinase